MKENTREALLLAGAVLGIGLAVLGSMAPAPVSDPDIVALIDGRPLSRADYDRALDTLASDKKNRLSDADRQFVLNRLIDEKLLLARSLELGLPEQDSAVRKAAINAMVEFILADKPAATPDDATLEAYYQTHKDLFTPPVQYAVRTLFVADGQDSARLAGIDAALKAGTAFDSLPGDDWVAAPPRAALPVGVLSRALGETGASAVATMQVGETRGPFAAGGGVYYLHLAGVKARLADDFATARLRVLAEWQRRQDEQAVRAYIAWLRNRAEIQVPEAGE